MTRYIVRGYYTPSDFSFFTDDPTAPYSTERSFVVCDTRKEAEQVLAVWYAGGEIEEVKSSGGRSLPRRSPE